MGCGASKGPSIESTTKTGFSPSIEMLITHPPTTHMISTSTGTNYSSNGFYSGLHSSRPIGIKRISEVYQVDTSTGSLVEKPITPALGQGIRIIGFAERKKSFSSSCDSPVLSTHSFSHDNKTDSSTSKDFASRFAAHRQESNKTNASKSYRSLIPSSFLASSRTSVANPSGLSQAGTSDDRKQTHLIPIPRSHLMHAISVENTVGIVSGRPITQNEMPSSDLKAPERNSLFQRRHSDIPTPIQVHVGGISPIAIQCNQESNPSRKPSEEDEAQVDLSISSIDQAQAVNASDTTCIVVTSPEHNPTPPMERKHRRDQTDEIELDIRVSVDTNVAIQEALSKLAISESTDIENNRGVIIPQQTFDDDEY